MARILIVDDEKSIRVTLGEFLRGDGHVVELAGDAEQAQKVLGRAAQDIVVTDIILPRVSGVELLQIIRRTAPEVAVIMMTGEPTVETATAAVRAGACDYLMKPVAKAAILKAVRHAAEMKGLLDEKRRLEEMNERYRRELEQRVDQRTHELREANERLENTLAELQRSQDQIIQQERLKALGQMASGIAHDFNNALMPIVGFSEYLLSHPEALSDHDDVRRLLRIIYTAGKDGANVVRRMREFYRPEQKLETESVELKSLIEDAVSLTEPKWKQDAMAKGATIQVEIRCAAALVIECNKSHLREALINLILNAVDAMPGGGTLSIDAEAVGTEAVLHLQDTGVGMSEEVRRRCFESFFSTKGNLGTGMGLAMVYGIVQRHGGSVEVRSVAQQGTTFTIRLPLRAAVAAPAPASGPCAALPALRVLVVDDEEWSRQLLAHYLTSDGHTVEVAVGGREAVAQLDASRFDVVITDRAMPGMNGDELARQVKQRTPDVPVVLLTGFGDLMNDWEERPPGVDVVVGKPIEQEALRKVLATVLAKGRKNAGQ